MASGGTRVVTGKFYGTGAALNIRTVGFRPTIVRLINTSSADSLVWTKEMADAAGLKSVAAGTNSVITSGGITPLSNGFTLGTDTDMNVSGESVIFEAHE